MARDRSRREFLKASGVFGLSLVSPRPARIRGRVRERGGGVAGVTVSDGLSSVATDEDGAFEIVSDRRARFVHASIPDGYRIPRDRSGLARIYQPLDLESRSEETASFDLEPADSAKSHRFLVFGDTQIETEAEGDLLDAAMPEVARLAGGSASFGVTCGDLVHDALDLFPRYRAAVGSTGVPFFQAVGNHDLDTARGSVRGRRSFEAWFGPTRYSFNVGEVHYVVLDDVFWLGDGYVGFVDEDQFGWLASDLALVEKGRTVVVFAHVPFLSTISERIGGRIAKREAEVVNRDRVIELLQPFHAHFITAHTHESEHVIHEGIHEHVVSTVCGAWWAGPICWDGTPNGYHLYEARGGSLSWQFYPTGLGDLQLRVYPAGSDPRRPDEVVANVWNWDPDWTVLWYENGVRKGEMTRARGLDPLAVSLYEGKDRPRKNPEWVDPVPTDHLFHARATDPSATVKVAVEVTDRFGRTFASEIAR
jgi:C terminal of Calcineurin-like phosphoesterase/N terminal of Calcineurin-like phosphoesterase